MSKKPKKKEPTIDDLVKLADEVGLPVGALDTEIADACDREAEMRKEDLCGSTLKEQLQYLDYLGYDIGVLEQLIRELANKKEDS